MFVVTQLPWSVEDIDETLEDLVARAQDEVPPGTTAVVLLPVAEDPEFAPELAVMLAQVSAIAMRRSCFVAGAAAARREDGRAMLHGFVVGPEGSRIVAPKVLPELARGYRDRPVALDAPAQFAALESPLGRLGLLVDDDVLAPHLVRATAFAGCEILLNPCSHAGDRWSQVRDVVRGARAYENHLWLLSTAAPATAFDSMGEAWRCGAGAAFFRVPVDIGALRSRRQETFANFLAMHRTSLYARGYRQLVEAAPPAPRGTTPSTRVEWVAEAQRRVAAAETRAAGAPRVEQYGVVLAQTLIRRLPDLERRDAAMRANLLDSIALAAPLAAAPSVRLVVFPEYWMSGVVIGRPPADWQKLAIELPGREIEPLQEFARTTKCYVAGAAFEFDPRWPGRWFNTAFVLDDRGELIHRYRKIQCGDLVGLLPSTTPGNVLSEYLDRYGYEGLFPVVDTPLGRLGTMVCFDMNFPETARELVRRGAEVLIHPTAEPHNTRRRGWDLARRARAFENTAYVLSACVGGELQAEGARPQFFHRGYSKIVNFDGSVQVVADTGGEVALGGEIDMAALRRARRDGLANAALWDEPRTYAGAYAAHAGFPEDVWLAGPMQASHEGVAHVREVIARYTRERVFVAPGPG